MPSAAALQFGNSWGIRRIGHRQPACSLHLEFTLHFAELDFGLWRVFAIEGP
jgi:hypothetical protein